MVLFVPTILKLHNQYCHNNRKAHVKFRKDNPIFYEQIPVLLPRLESIEKNVYKPCTYWLQLFVTLMSCV